MINAHMSFLELVNLFGITFKQNFVLLKTYLSNEEFLQNNSTHQAQTIGEFNKVAGEKIRLTPLKIPKYIIQNFKH